MKAITRKNDLYFEKVQLKKPDDASRPSFDSDLKLFRDSLLSKDKKKSLQATLSHYLPGTFRVDHLVRSLILGATAKQAASVSESNKQL